MKGGASTDPVEKSEKKQTKKKGKVTGFDGGAMGPRVS
jgi:hypothetical protein